MSFLPRRHPLICWAACGLVLLLCSGCLKYGFTGTSIPENVNDIFIPFFADQSNSGVPDLSDRLNQSLVQRFINDSRLQLANNRANADAILEGTIVSYSNQPFSITGEDRANQNEVKISVRASYAYTDSVADQQSQFNKTFTGAARYDPNDQPIQGETNAAQQALTQIANNMFNDAVTGW